jgi:hypothetical protein
MTGPFNGIRGLLRNMIFEIIGSMLKKKKLKNGGELPYEASGCHICAAI